MNLIKSETNPDNMETDRPRLLVIEDDYENQKLIETYLKRKFTISICDSESTFYERLKESKYDVFLVDISLRGNKDGLQLVKELRESADYSDAPIICISAHVFPRDRQNAFNAGVDEFLPRPVRNEEMLATILEVYRNKTGRSI